MTIHTRKSAIIASLALGCAISFTACEKKETPAEKIEEGVKDALDQREHEEIKDAVEEIKEGVKDAAQNTENAVKDALDARENEELQDAAEEVEQALEDASQ